MFVFVDEELGGLKGMKLFVELDYFKKLNVGFALDEGLTMITATNVTRSEKTKLTCTSEKCFTRLVHFSSLLLTM